MMPLLHSTARQRLALYLALIGAAVLLQAAWQAPQPSSPVPDHSSGSGFTVLSAPLIPSPRRLVVPRLSIDAQVVEVGLTVDGRMEVPPDVAKAGWYTQGVAPGAPGNAVMAGHLNDAAGVPGVFWDLHRLRPGDMAAVSGEGALRTLFRVRKVTSYPYDDAPMEEIFLGGSGRTLVLITCGGAWDARKGTYKERVVVFADAI